MRKNVIFRTLVVVGIATLTMVGMSCKSKPEGKAPEGFKEINVPCSAEGTSDANFFRANTNAISTNMQFAQEKALSAAKNILAGYINTKVKAVTDRYANEYTVGDKMEFSEKFENLSRQVVNQTLTDVKKICEKVGTIEGGKYQCYIALEASKEAILNGLNNAISKNEKLKVDYDKMKFEKIFNEEMKKLEDESNK